MKACKTCWENTSDLEKESCLNCGAFFPLPQDEVKMIIENFLSNNVGNGLRAAFNFELEKFDDDLHDQLENEFSLYSVAWARQKEELECDDSDNLNYEEEQIPWSSYK